MKQQFHPFEHLERLCTSCSQSFLRVLRVIYPGVVASPADGCHRRVLSKLFALALTLSDPTVPVLLGALKELLSLLPFITTLLPFASSKLVRF